MAKLNSGMAGKLKEMARDLKEEENNPSTVKKLVNAGMKAGTRKKQSDSDAKASGRKD